MTTTDTHPGDTTDREIVLSREFDAPRELVFQAYTDPAHLPHWWGPDGFTNTVYEIDVRTGGRWRFMMHGPDGTEYPNRITYQEVAAPERLVYLHGEDVDNDPGAFHVTIRFDDLGGRTRVTQRMLFNSKAQRDGVISFGAVELGNQTMAKLAAHLERMRQS
ncbi:SRPBCC family protein [Longimicrobium sp.]|uniref:SRPBCC family protein n=1 Tax=Longimicrobium sp. TaxID=2029185 RepID=UPI002E329A0B|nr:SRPBCC family protein [Longimicrobium sp.]HEX6039522.1 SRPBCC family protein [Longimicrobium sp.]